MGHQKVLRGAVVKAGKAIHQSIAQRIQSFAACAGLWDASPAPAGQIERSHRYWHASIDPAQGRGAFLEIDCKHVLIDSGVEAWIVDAAQQDFRGGGASRGVVVRRDRKSTRLNSSHEW